MGNTGLSEPVLEQFSAASGTLDTPSTNFSCDAVASTAAPRMAGVNQASEIPALHPLEEFVVVLLERAAAATDPQDRASFENHAYAVERLIDYDTRIPWRRS